MNLLLIDTETSDLDPDKGAKLLEIAWIDLEFTGQGWEVADMAERYIQYEGPISPHAQATHHISRDSLTEESGAIKRYDAVLQLLKRFKEDTFCVAHNAAFDSKFIPEITKPWICTMRAAKHVWPSAPGYSNQVLRYWLGIEFTITGRHPHQAFYDVFTTKHILLKMLEKRTPQELLYLSTAPLRLQTINFGKHKGMEFSNVPRDYLLWLRNQGNLDPDLRHTIDSILKP